MENHYKYSDSQFETEFEQGSLDPTLFNHEAHLRLTWIQLEKYGFEKAIENIQTQILNYVTKLGAEDKFHVTLTHAAIHIVNHFKQQSTSDSFLNFITEFPKLKNNFKELINTHYSAEKLHSPGAKTEYLEPDLQPFS